MKTLHRIILILGVTFLVLLIWKLGPEELASELWRLGWLWAPLLLLEGIGEALHAAGWRLCLSKEHQKLPWIRTAMIRQAGMAFNYLTPTAHMGGEVVKGVLLGRNGNPVGATTGILVGKLALVISQLTFVSFGSMAALFFSNVPEGLWIGWAASTAVVTSGVTAFFIIQRRGNLGGVVRFIDRLGIGGKAVSRFSQTMTEIDGQLRTFYRTRSRDLVSAIFIHALGFACGIVQTWIFLAYHGYSNPVTTALTIWFLGAWFDLIGFIVPAGVGVQEGSRVFIFHYLGFSQVTGLAFGFVLRVTKAVWAIVGLLCYGALTGRRKGPELLKVEK